MSTAIHWEDGIELFAGTISDQPLRLAVYSPENWAETRRCFENVWKKVRRDGGSCRYGWTFQHCKTEAGEYLVAAHHAVWHAPDYTLIDVTPFPPDQKLNPVIKGGDTVFLVDDEALPISGRNITAPRPLKYFPLNDSVELTAYIEKLGREEQAKWQAICADAEKTASGASRIP
jgi:hypothetical protein